MLRKFQSFRTLYQFQLARIANDPRKQDGFGKNIGEKLQDSAKNAWDTAKEKVTHDEKKDHDLNKDKAYNTPFTQSSSTSTEAHK